MNLLATTTKPRSNKGNNKHGKFRSGLEVEFAKIVTGHGYKYKYEKSKFEYLISEIRTYTPDFEINNIFFETKGRLTSFDRRRC